MWSGKVDERAEVGYTPYSDVGVAEVEYVLDLTSG
jgi:hypothetical protein